MEALRRSVAEAQTKKPAPAKARASKKTASAPRKKAPARKAS